MPPDGPLSKAQHDIFWSTPEDKAPETLLASREDLAGRHYLASDERYLHRFAEHIKDLGGAFAGVGTDQTYLMMGLMKADLAWLTDYDPWVVALHQAYKALFAYAGNYQAFVNLWKKQNASETRAILRRALATHPDRRHILRVWKVARGQTWLRFVRVRSAARKDRIPTFLTNKKQYEFVRRRVLEGRVRPLVCDLTAEICMRSIAGASKRLGVPLRALYLSNAEEYWPYPDAFRENVRVQNFDEKSVILRAAPTKKRNGDYAYFVQNAKRFVRWLDKPFVHRVAQIHGRIELDDEDHIPVLVLDAEPPDPTERPYNPRARRVPSMCTYKTYSWSTEERRAVGHRTVKKPYSAVTNDERSPEAPRCSVCSEDQVLVAVGSLPRIRVCHVYAEKVRHALATIVTSGEFSFRDLEGYRVGRTRGPVVDGVRTELSNHSYGTAIDINADRNGLYGRCDIDVSGSPKKVRRELVDQCRLRVGGHWKPRRKRTTIVRDGVVYDAFAKFWKWGGEIDGRTKDFMHFSVTGF